MLKFLLKRIGYMFLTIFIIATATFMLMHVIPGDPLTSETKQLPLDVQENIYAKYGLNKPVTEQYRIFLKNAIHGNLGESYKYPGRTVSDMLKLGLPISARIGVQGVILGFALGCLFGIIAAFNRGKWPDYIVMFIALLGVSVPSFVFASLLQYFFGVKWGILPISGWETEHLLKYTILPTLALSLGPTAVYARYMRASCLDVINQDYILTARAKGVSKVSLVWKHVIRNAILPAITILGPQLAGVIMGSLVIESIFAIPGMGDQFVSAVTNRDYPIIMGLTIFIALLYVISLLVVDLVYGLIDPRIRVTGEKR